MLSLPLSPLFGCQNVIYGRDTGGAGGSYCHTPPFQGDHNEIRGYGC
jgi:hypothetical protein